MDNRIQYLKDQKIEFDEAARKHSLYSGIYTIIHSLIGWPQVILAVLITSINGMTKMDSVFVMGLFNSILSVTLVFFKITDRASKHHASKCQWEDLSIDAEYCLVNFDEQKMDEFEVSVVEKQKFIKSYEPPFCLECIIPNKLSNPT